MSNAIVNNCQVGNNQKITYCFKNNSNEVHMRSEEQRATIKTNNATCSTDSRCVELNESSIEHNFGANKKYVMLSKFGKLFNRRLVQIKLCVCFLLVHLLVWHSSDSKIYEFICLIYMLLIYCDEIVLCKKKLANYMK